MGKNLASLESYAEIIRVVMDRTDDGLFVATSTDLPGFLIAHTDATEIEDDIPNVIRMLIRRRTKQDVVVTRVLPHKSEPNSWVSIPTFVVSTNVPQ